jgi:hypothetical protein
LTEIFLTPTEVLPCFSLSCKANARVKLAKTGHGPHSSTLVVICVVPLLFVLFYVLFVCKCVLPPGDNPIAVNKYIISHHIITLCHCVPSYLRITYVASLEEQFPNKTVQLLLTVLCVTAQHINCTVCHSTHINLLCVTAHTLTVLCVIAQHINCTVCHSTAH